MQLLKRKLTGICYFVSIAATVFLAAAYSSGQIKRPAKVTDQQQAERVLQEYLQLRKGPESYKRYRLLSKKVKDLLKKESGVDNESKFKDMISDEASWVDSRVIVVKKMKDNQMRAEVYCKVVTEHDPGGIVSEGRCEFILIKEGADWQLDALTIDGRNYVP